MDRKRSRSQLIEFYPGAVPRQVMVRVERLKGYVMFGRKNEA